MYLNPMSVFGIDHLKNLRISQACIHLANHCLYCLFQCLVSNQVQGKNEGSHVLYLHEMQSIRCMSLDQKALETV